MKEGHVAGQIGIRNLELFFSFFFLPAQRMKHASLADMDERRQIRMKCLDMSWFTVTAGM